MIILKCFWGKVEASDEINFLCGLLGNFPPVVISIPNVNTKVVSSVHSRCHFWYAKMGQRGNGNLGYWQEIAWNCGPPDTNWLGRKVKRREMLMERKKVMGQWTWDSNVNLKQYDGCKWEWAWRLRSLEEGMNSSIRADGKVQGVILWIKSALKSEIVFRDEVRKLKSQTMGF